MNKLTERREMHAALIKPLSDKYSIDEIAKIVGVSIGTVNGIQNDPKYGIINPRRKREGSNKKDRSAPAEGCVDYKKMGRMF
jgi:transposase